MENVRGGKIKKLRKGQPSCVYSAFCSPRLSLSLSLLSMKPCVVVDWAGALNF